MASNRPSTAPGSGGGDGQPPPPPNRYFQNAPSRSSFAHRLPPLMSSHSSPRHGHYYPPSPGYRDIPSMGHTDPASWASERPTSNRSSNRWSPTLPALALSPRHPSFEISNPQADGRGSSQGLHHLGNPQHRLPPLADYPQRPMSGWGDPPSTGHSSITSRPPTSYESFRPSSSHHRPHPPQFGVPPSHSFPPPPEHRASDVQAYSPAVDSPELSSTRGPPGSPQESGKKKKRRVALSCAECSKRKQKCNRETPCQHCVSRRVPELCVPYSKNSSPGRAEVAEKKEARREVKMEPDTGLGGTPGLAEEVPLPAPPLAQAMTASTSGARSNVLPTLSIRVMRLEAMVNTMINKVPGLEGKALQDWRINHAPASAPSSSEIPLRLRGTSAVSSRTRPGTGDTAREREASPGAEIGLMTGIDVESSTRNPLPQSMLDTDEPVPLGLDSHYSPVQHLQGIFIDNGVPSHKIQDLMAELPPRENANDLVDWFFTKVNYVRYPISEHLFRQGFAILYDNRSISPEAALALPLVFIVLALAIRVAPDQWVGAEDQKRTSSLRMYWNCKSDRGFRLTISEKSDQYSFGGESGDNTIGRDSSLRKSSCSLAVNPQADMQTGLYLVLMHERRLAQGWAEFRAAITTGQAIGLHRDGSKLGLDEYAVEYRRRLWSYLIHADATYSCLLGRPVSIDLRFCDTLPPSNLNMDKYQSSTSPPAPKPRSEPTFATYLILRRSLGEIMAKVTKHFQRLDGGGGYEDIEALDKELRLLRDALPEAFRMDNPVRDWDENCWYLPVHRYYIQTEILHFTIILHRPWLLRRLKTDRYQLSRQACFEAALMDYKIRQAWKKDCPDFFETLLGSSFRAFNAAMIAGISMIVDPRGPHAADMRHIVADFMQEHPHNPRADDFSQKEAAIIYTLHRRAQEMEERRSARHPRVRPNLSNERGQHQSSTSVSPTLAGHTGAENGFTEPPRRHRSSMDSSFGGADINQNRFSFVVGAQGSTATGMTPASSTSDEEGPQKLLDQWLLANTSFGPGSDPAINPYINTLTGVPSYFQYDPSTSDLEQQQSLTGGQNPGISQIGSSSGSYPTMRAQPNFSTLGPEQGVLGLGIDPSAPGLIEQGGGVETGSVRSLVGPPGEDGNPTVFWDRLIDGIVVGQGYDLMGTPSI